MDDFQQLLLETFAEEARETVQALEKALIGLERAGGAEARAEQYAILARRAHNLKGAAGAAGVVEVQNLAHALEDGLQLIRDLDTPPSPEHFDLLYAGIDAIRQIAVDSEATPPDEETLDALQDALRDILKASADVPTQRVPSDPTIPTLPPVEEGSPEVEATRAENAARFIQYELTDSGPVPAEHIAEDATPPDPEEPSQPETAPEPEPEPEPEPTQPPEAEFRPDSLVTAPAAAIEEPPEEPEPTKISSSPPSSPPSSPASTARSTRPEAPIQTIRVSVEKLDALMNQIGEIITIRKKTEARLAEVDVLANSVSTLSRQFQALQQQAERALESASSDRADSLHEGFVKTQRMISELESSFFGFHRQASHDAVIEGILTERLPEDIKRLRMRPFTTVEDQFHRTVRDAARRTGKRVHLDLQGMETEADQGVLDAVRDPMMHLLRNCVDHGIEPPEERRAAGKRDEGRIRITIEGRSATMLITVSDDGRGIDPAELRARVVERNLIPQSVVDKMSDREVLDLIFLPGFSTASNVGMLSGRGIGMDVVRQVAQQHHGSVSVDTQLGLGTTFTLELPLTFATVQGIIVDVLGHDFALPIYAVDRLVRLSRNDIIYVEGAPAVLVDDEPLSLVSLSDLLEVPPDLAAQEEEAWSHDEVDFERRQSLLNAAVIKVNDRRIAFIVDDFVGDSEMVVKDLTDVLGQVPNVAGATVTWSGDVMVILNPAELMDSALTRVGAVQPSKWLSDKPRERRILVCDDSLTTRTLEKNILVAAGYEVEAATNGLEALRLIDRSDFQLIVLDVDMPELNGFELTRRLRSIKNYREVPIILVTSRDSEEDKRRGLSAGADAYISKQSFTQRTFLETVRRFLE